VLHGWITDLARILHATYLNWRRTRTIRLGAGIAYYALFALVPLVSLSIFLAQLVVDPLHVEEFFVDAAERLGITPEASTQLTDELGASTVERGLGIVGFASLVFAAALVFFALQDAFDEVWEVPVVDGVKNSIRRRLLAFAVVGGGGVIIVLLLVISSVSTILQHLIPGSDNLLTGLGDLVGFLSSWVVMLVALAVLFQVLSKVHIDRLALLTGSVTTGALLAIGTSLLGIYLSDYAGQSFTGVAAGILLALLWLYYVSQMLLVGVHLTRVIHEIRTGVDWYPDQAGSV
jgi:membrane protein